MGMVDRKSIPRTVEGARSLASWAGGRWGADLSLTRGHALSMTSSNRVLGESSNLGQAQVTWMASDKEHGASCYSCLSFCITSWCQKSQDSSTESGTFSIPRLPRHSLWQDGGREGSSHLGPSLHPSRLAQRLHPVAPRNLNSSKSPSPRWNRKLLLNGAQYRR